MHRKAYIYFEMFMNKMIITKNVKVDEQAPCYPFIGQPLPAKRISKTIV
jgi:hypothetical protein